MALIDFILNLAGLLLWLNWRSVRFDPLGKRTPATLIGTLRRAEPRRLRRWHLLAALGGLLLLRAVILLADRFGGQAGLGGHTGSGRRRAFLPQRFVCRGCCLFSIFSFGLMLGMFYLWLLLLSILAGPEPLPFHRLVRMPLGGIDRWPRWVKFLLPLMVTAAFWWLASWLLAWLQVIPATRLAGASHRRIAGHRAGQLSGLEISHRRAARPASVEQLHLLRQTSVLGLRERRSANIVVALARGAAAAGQGGFCAGRGNCAGVSGGRTGRARTGFALRKTAVLRFYRPITQASRSSPWGIWPR